MFSNTRSALFVSAVAAVASAQGTTPAKTTANCPDVAVFMARGNNAPYQPDGRTFVFEQTLCQKVAPLSCDYIDVVFDATYGAPFCPQIVEGATNGQSELAAYVKKCPCSKAVIMGYSEGAEVIADVLGGPSMCAGSYTGLDPNSAAGKSLAAVLLFGDVTHAPNQPYNVLDGSSGGPSSRKASSLALMNRFTPILRSYCAGGDPVCAGGDNVTQHLNYFEVYTDSATSWAVSKLNEKADLCPTSSSSSATPSATSKASSSVLTSATPTPTASDSASGTPGTPYSPSKPTTLATSGYTHSAMPLPSQGSDYGEAPVPGDGPNCKVVYEYVTMYN